MSPSIKFLHPNQDLAAEISVPHGTTLSEAARLAGFDVHEPCGGQGRCGRCLLQVASGEVRPRSTLRLSVEDSANGFVLGCQVPVESNISVFAPAAGVIEHRLKADRVARDAVPPAGYDAQTFPSLQRYLLELPPPTLDNQTDDTSRIQVALRQQTGITDLTFSLDLLRGIGAILRQAGWLVTAVVERSGSSARLVRLIPSAVDGDQPLWAAAVDIGTTTVTVWLVDLRRGTVAAQASDYNAQIARGEDVISRIIYASKHPRNLEEINRLVIETINRLLVQACADVHIQPEEILKAVVVGNSTMTHLFLKLPVESIRLEPYITTTNHPTQVYANEVGLTIYPGAVVDCLPGVASYVGSDITAGVLSSGCAETDKLTLFLDMGTNGEIVLGSREWLMTCACSAGPAFEGAGVECGMRATRGAIEEVWINGANSEPETRVIGGEKPRGLCGSGLLSLLAELFLEGVVDKAGHINTHLATPRIRQGAHGTEYVVAWGSKTQSGADITISEVDINNLLRAKAAIFAGFSVLANSAGIALDSVDQVLIGGSFGKYINIEKAIQVGLLPDLPWETFQFLGNTAVKGAYFCLLDQKARARVNEIASRLTYLELSADNSFYEAFISALFLPHTDLSRFPSVLAAKNTK